MIFVYFLKKELYWDFKVIYYNNLIYKMEPGFYISEETN
jgi:hypothetical protein